MLGAFRQVYGTGEHPCDYNQAFVTALEVVLGCKISDWGAQRDGHQGDPLLSTLSRCHAKNSKIHPVNFEILQAKRNLTTALSQEDNRDAALYEAAEAACAFAQALLCVARSPETCIRKDRAEGRPRPAEDY